MTDREKLIELIVDIENELISAYPYTTDEYRIRETVDYLITNGVMLYRWIPVTERLPECENGSESKPLFFVTKTGGIEAGYFGKYGIYRDNYFRPYRDRFEGYDADDIVCWMWQSALPEPPKEG